MKRLLILVLLAGCSSSSEPEAWRRVVGTVIPEMSSIQAVKFPAAVDVDQLFTVTVTTVGSSSCTRVDGAEVDNRDSEATITPYDRVAPEDRACTDDLHAFPRDVQVRFRRAGQATLKVKARTSTGTRELTYQISVR